MASTVMKFIDVSSDVHPQKRKNNRRACGDCRHRKRRCPHDYGGPIMRTSISSAPASEAHTSPIPSLSRSIDSTESTNHSKTHRQNGLRVTIDERSFGSHAGPPSSRRLLASAPQSATQVEAHSLPPNSQSSSDSESENGPKFVGHLNPEGEFLATTRGGASRASIYDDDLGFWLPQRNGRQGEEGEPPLSSLQLNPTSSRARGPSKDIESSQHARKARVLPDSQTFKTLRTIYFRDVHPLFPIIQAELLPERQTGDELSFIEIVLMQSLCLAVATNSTARPFLRLQHSDSLLTPKQFATRLSKELIAALHMADTMDRLVSVRVLAILSLFSQLSNNDHIAAEYCARAVSYIHTMQLHLDTACVRDDNVTVTQIFLCVWMLDRLNTVFHSRPSLMHARDIGRDMEASIRQQDPAFRALLMICGYLEEITDIYRPPKTSKLRGDNFIFPSFEDLVVGADAVSLPTHLLATIEVLYHAVAMLSHRPHSIDDPDRSSISYLRSTLSAARLVAVVNNVAEFGASLSNFPFVPYGISLALRVSYRELRFSKTTFHRSIARRQLLAVCSLLHNYGDTFAFARRLAILARKTVREMDKVAASVLQARHNETGRSRASEMPNENNGSAQTTDNVQDSNNTVANVQEENNQVAVAIQSTVQPKGPQIPQYDPTQYTAESFDVVHKIPDLPDLFEHFDPAFNLDAIDCALSQNIEAGNLADFGLSPDMDWMSASGMSNTLPGSTPRYPFSYDTMLLDFFKKQ